MNETNNNPFNKAADTIKDAAKNAGSDLKEMANEIVGKMGVTYEKAVEALERNGLSVVNAMLDLQEQTKTKAEACWQQSKENIDETINKAKTKVQATCNKENAEELWQKTKACLATPIEVCNCGDKKLEMPAGIVGAGVVSLLYPLHQNKTLAVLGAAGVGAWLYSKNRNRLKSKVAEEGQQYITAFTAKPIFETGDGSCFSVEPVGDAVSSAENNAENITAKEAASGTEAAIEEQIRQTTFDIEK